MCGKGNSFNMESRPIPSQRDRRWHAVINSQTRSGRKLFSVVRKMYPLAQDWPGLQTAALPPGNRPHMASHGLSKGCLVDASARPPRLGWRRWGTTRSGPGREIILSHSDRDVGALVAELAGQSLGFLCFSGLLRTDASEKPDMLFAALLLLLGVCPRYTCNDAHVQGQWADGRSKCSGAYYK